MPVEIHSYILCDSMLFRFPVFIELLYQGSMTKTVFVIKLKSYLVLKRKKGLRKYHNHIIILQ